MISDIIERSTHVRDYDYNNVGSEEGKNRFSSIEELERYLDKIFIPNNIAYKRIYNNNFSAGKKLSIQFNRILSLKCSENEIKHILQYLCDRDINVGGFVSTLEGEYNNYDYKHTYKLSQFPTCMSWEEQKELFDKYIVYKKTNNPKKNDIAKKIAEGCLRLIRYVTYKYSLFSGIDINEFDGYGCEGLMKAIDNFEPNLGYKFSTFAVPYIKNRVNNGLRELREFNNDRTFYSELIRCKTIIEKGYSEDAGADVTIYDNPQIIEDIVSLMVETYGFSKKMETNLRRRINIIYHSSYEECEELIYDYDMEEKVIEEEEKQILWNIINSVSKKERDVILKRFGFNSDNIMTLEEIGKLYGVSKERIRQIENKTLSMFKNHKGLR